jgi:hypothetical protein
MPTFERPAIVEWNRSQALVTRASHRPRSSEPQNPYNEKQGGHEVDSNLLPLELNQGTAKSAHR